MNKIRRAENKDIKKVIDLLHQVCMVHHIGRPDLFKGPATKYTESQLIDIFKNDNTPVFVCIDEKDEALGYAFCVLKQEKSNNVLTDIKTLYIDDLCVDENVRGKHIGKTLYEFVLEYAKEIGCYNVTLNVWTCNENAMKFYENCGLTPQKICMEKIL